jgi:hypothetical protein
MTDEYVQKQVLTANAEIATICDDVDSQREPMIKNVDEIGEDFVEYKVANYQYSVIRRSGYYVPLKGTILTAEAFVRQTGRPEEVCIPVPMNAGESDDCRRWRAHNELQKLVGGFYTQIYEVDNITYQ